MIRYSAKMQYWIDFGYNANILPMFEKGLSNMPFILCSITTTQETVLMKLQYHYWH